MVGGGGEQGYGFAAVVGDGRCYAAVLQLALEDFLIYCSVLVR